MEYGCFNLDGTIIKNQDLLNGRQRRNILYYTIRDSFCLSRNIRQQYQAGSDPIKNDPKGNWAVILTDNCRYKKEIEEALDPLINLRSGKIITIPKISYGYDPTVHRWIQENFINKTLPDYLLLCDSFENIPIEYQFILNALVVTGRLWFEQPHGFNNYVKKLMDVENGKFDVGTNITIASPTDDKVTQIDYDNILKPLLNEMKILKPIIGNDFSRESLTETAINSRFLALYCHGIALHKKDFDKNPDLQGAFVLDSRSKMKEGLLTPSNISNIPFVPGGIVFSPACLAGGTIENSDYSYWIMQHNLAPYLGKTTSTSSICNNMLSSLIGPIASLLHFDISMFSNAPMFNPFTNKYDLQTMIHIGFIRDLLGGQTLGKATRWFRWATGAYYNQSIQLFEQLTGDRPYRGTSGIRKTVRQFVESMNRYHVTATDMRNYVIMGDPAVSLPI